MDFPHYQQTSDTCGASSLLSVLHYFQPEQFPLSEELENEIYQECRVGKHADDVGRRASPEFQLPGRGTMGVDMGANTIPGLAEYALDHGFQARLYQENENFEYLSHWTQDAFETMNQVYHKFRADAVGKGLEVTEGDFGIDDLLEQEVDKGRPTLVWLPHNGPIYHIVVLYDREDDLVHVMDPLEEENRRITSNTIQNKVDSIEPEIGGKALSVWK